MTSWMRPLDPRLQAPPSPEQILIRWCVKLGRLTRWPSPIRPWVLRRQAEMLEISAAITELRSELAKARTEVNRATRALDEIVQDAQTEANATDAIARIRREWRTKEKH